jgi:RNA polymerase sigma-70 factor (ECF subfamily)
MAGEAPMRGTRDNSALRSAIEESVLPARRFLFGMCGCWEQAEDMVQEAMLKAWARRESFDGRSDARTWLFAIVRNHWRDCLRKKMSRSGQQTRDLEDAAQIADGHPAPPEKALRTELSAALDKALARLPDEQREALALRESEGLTFAQIAQMLDLPVPTVKSRVRYALLKLSEELQPYRESMT